MTIVPIVDDYSEIAKRIREIAEEKLRKLPEPAPQAPTPAPDDYMYCGYSSSYAHCAISGVQTFDLPPRIG